MYVQIFIYLHHLICYNNKTIITWMIDIIVTLFPMIDAQSPIILALDVPNIQKMHKMCQNITMQLIKMLDLINNRTVGGCGTCNWILYIILFGFIWLLSVKHQKSLWSFSMCFIHKIAIFGLKIA